MSILDSDKRVFLNYLLFILVNLPDLKVKNLIFPFMVDDLYKFPCAIISSFHLKTVIDLCKLLTGRRGPASGSSGISSSSSSSVGEHGVVAWMSS
jgi:hypothetical protein